MAQPVTLVASGVGSTAWKNANYREAAFHLQVNCSVSGTVTYNLETTNSDYLTPGTTVNVIPTAIAAATASAYQAITSPVRAWRITITAGSGSVTAEAIQSGY